MLITIYELYMELNNFLEKLKSHTCKRKCPLQKDVSLHMMPNEGHYMKVTLLVNNKSFNHCLVGKECDAQSESVP